MSKLIFNSAAYVNTDTYGTCVKLQPSTNYTDTIFRNIAYVGQTPKTIKVVNSCVTPYTLTPQNIFTDALNGGDFVASVGTTSLPAFTTVDVPVAYTGTYKGTNNSPSYTITINGSTATYSLSILTPDSAPTTQDNTITLNNRIDTVVTKNSLIYADPDGDVVDKVRFLGDVSKLYTDVGRTALYVAGTELDIATFTLYYKAPNQDTASTFQPTYNVKANGVWST